MSPAKGRQQFIASRPRSEVFTAVAVGVTIVVASALLIWLLRPGPVGVPGKGGLLARQPRMALLVVLAVAALGGWAAYILRRRKDPPLGRRRALALGGIVIVALVVIAGIFWPGGIIRHWIGFPKVEDTPESSVPSSPSTGTGSTTANPGTTVTPSSVTGTSATPTTVSAPTTKAG